MKLNEKQLHVLQHSLGLNQYGEGRQYRNHFATGEGSDDWPLCNEMVAAGYMQDHGPQSLAGGMHCFCVTPKGIDAVALQSPAPPKISRSRQRYLQFLDADSGMSFGEWLKYRMYQPYHERKREEELNRWVLSNL